MKLFKKKPEPIMIDRSKLTAEGILELSRQKPGIVFSQSVFLELIRQLDERVKKLEKKKK